MRPLIWALLLFATPAAAQVHIVQPFKFLWDYTTPVDRFEFNLDAGGYVNVGLPPLVGGSFAMQADPALSGAHSAVVRACSIASGCSPDSNILTFVVDGGPPTAERLTVGNVVMPPTPIASPSGTQMPPATQITDASGAVFTLAPLIGGVAGQTGVARNGVRVSQSVDYVTIDKAGIVWQFDIGSGTGWDRWTGNPTWTSTTAVPQF